MRNALLTRILCTFVLISQTLTGAFGAGRSIHLHGAHDRVDGHETASASRASCCPEHRSSSLPPRSSGDERRADGDPCPDGSPASHPRSTSIHLHLVAGPGDVHHLHGPEECLAFDLPEDDRRVDGDVLRLPWVTLAVVLPFDVTMIGCEPEVVPSVNRDGGGERERWRHRALRCVRIQV